jgi:cytochrome c2
MRLSRVSLVAAAAAALLVVTVAAMEYAVDTERETIDKAVKMTGGDPKKAPALMRRYGCTGCHQIPGMPGARGVVGPPLTGLAERVYVGGALPNTPDNVVAFILEAHAYRPNTAMPVTGIDERGARDIAAYLYSH